MQTVVSVGIRMQYAFKKLLGQMQERWGNFIGDESMRVRGRLYQERLLRAREVVEEDELSSKSSF